MKAYICTMNCITACCPKWRGCFVASVLFLLLLLAESCQSKTSPTPSASETAQDTLPRDFVTFFDRFHADSMYQINHITFPLAGLPDAQGDPDTVMTMRYFWQKENWKMHRPFTDPSQQFEQWFEILDTRIIEHWIHMKGTSLYLHRRFARLDNGWYLIYYAGMRPGSKNAGNEKEEKDK